MAKYIVVTGVTDAGKTTSLCKLWELLGGKPVYKKDFHGIIEKEKFKIGFHTWGDTVWCLDKCKGGIPDLEKQNCDIIICSAKSYGETHQYYIKRCKIDDAFFVTKLPQKNIAKSVECTATHIKILIDHTMKQ